MPRTLTQDTHKHSGFGAAECFQLFCFLLTYIADIWLHYGLDGHLIKTRIASL
uniref:Uncharacterized protein n=1 Tax=Arundo donax TaxID=35708 RepID=A0A0A8Z709_ARUDO